MTLRIFATGLLLALAVRADEPIIPPTISRVWPAGMQRGRTVTFTIDGRSLEGAKNVIFDGAGMTAKVSDIKEVPEKITGPRAGVDLAAQVARGKKATCRLEVTAARDVEPGIHRFRIQTPLGTSNMAVIAIGSLPEVQTQKASGTEAQRVKLPATLVGTIDTPGDRHNYSSMARQAKRSYFRWWDRSWVQNSNRYWCCGILPASNWPKPAEMKTAPMRYSVSNCRRKALIRCPSPIAKRAEGWTISIA